MLEYTAKTFATYLPKPTFVEDVQQFSKELSDKDVQGLFEHSCGILKLLGECDPAFAKFHRDAVSYLCVGAIRKILEKEGKGALGVGLLVGADSQEALNELFNPIGVKVIPTELNYISLVWKYCFFVDISEINIRDEKLSAVFELFSKKFTRPYFILPSYAAYE